MEPEPADTDVEARSSTSPERRRLLHRLASVLEATGFPHTIARVYAALMLAEGEGLSTGALVRELGVSKASITNAMQFLVGTELVERYRVPGSREAHYRTLGGKWSGILERKLRATTVVRSVTEEALDLVTSAKARERLQELHDVYAFFEREFARVMDRWNGRSTS